FLDVLTKHLVLERKDARGEAEQFLDTLEYHSSLLQYYGKDQIGQPLYGFPHLTIQEYLSARYIADQPYPSYINLVMSHIHEARWHQVHLLTLGRLGSLTHKLQHEKQKYANKASLLLCAILCRYKPLSRLLYPSLWRWLCHIQPG